MLYLIRVPCQGARNLTYLWDLMRCHLVKYANLDFSDKIENLAELKRVVASL